MDEDRIRCTVAHPVQSDDIDAFVDEMLENVVRCVYMFGDGNVHSATDGRSEWIITVKLDSYNN